MSRMDFYKRLDEAFSRRHGFFAVRALMALNAISIAVGRRIPEFTADEVALIIHAAAWSGKLFTPTESARRALSLPEEVAMIRRSIFDGSAVTLHYARGTSGIVHRLEFPAGSIRKIAALSDELGAEEAFYTRLGEMLDNATEDLRRFRESMA